LEGRDAHAAYLGAAHAAATRLLELELADARRGHASAEAKLQDARKNRAFYFSGEVCLPAR